jgi:cystathionine beta-lyase/cystathionine gamma-synthase
MMTARTEALFRQVKGTTMAFGDIPSPDDCYLTLRSLRSLGVRLRHHQASGGETGLSVAERSFSLLDRVQMLIKPMA